MKLNVKVFALTGGITWGLLIFAVTYFFLLMGYDGSTLGKLHKIYIGYSVTWYGGFIGMAYGFVDGLLIAAFFAWLYNKLSADKE
jgi:hypothetical protein